MELKNNTYSQLESMVNDVAAADYSDYVNPDIFDEDSGEWVENENFIDPLEVSYLVDEDTGDDLGVEILVCSGGPTIRVSTYTNTIVGIWGTDKVVRYLRGDVAIDLEEAFLPSPKA